MFEYQLSTNPKEELKKIYVYEFTEAKADEYNFGFFETFEEITCQPI